MDKASCVGILGDCITLAEPKNQEVHCEKTAPHPGGRLTDCGPSCPSRNSPVTLGTRLQPHVAWSWHWHHSPRDLAGVTAMPWAIGPQTWFLTMDPEMAYDPDLTSLNLLSCHTKTRQETCLPRPWDRLFDLASFLQQILKWLCNSAPAPLRCSLGVVLLLRGSPGDMLLWVFGGRPANLFLNGNSEATLSLNSSHCKLWSGTNIFCLG